MRVLITAGPTREPIDPVRFISNHSSGKMGYALAKSAVAMGHDVILVSGPVTLSPPEQAELVRVQTAAEMTDAVLSRYDNADIIIMAAAVADYRPKDHLSQKLKKSDGDLTLVLERTTDILAELGTRKRADQCLVGFAAETENLRENAQGKLTRKNLDWIVANRVGQADRGFAADTNAATVISRRGDVIDLPLTRKTDLAREILKIIMSVAP